MATNDITELLSSPVRLLRGYNWMQERRTYRVEGVPPSRAIQEGVFPVGSTSGIGGFPVIGTKPTTDSFGNVDTNYEFRGVLLTEYSVPYWAPGSVTDAQVEAIYETAIDTGDASTTNVIWEESGVSDSETIFFDIVTGERIPGGAQRRIGYTQMTAMLDGTVITSLMQRKAYHLNNSTFRGWNSGEVLYTTAKERLISGYDGFSGNGSTERGIAVVTLTFLAREGGWKEVRPVLHPPTAAPELRGRPMVDAQGNVITTEYNKYPTTILELLDTGTGFDLMA